MKAKEYFEKHFNEIPISCKPTILLKAAEDCFVDFHKEQKEAINKVKQLSSKISKIKEFQAKWAAIAALVEKKYGPTAVQKISNAKAEERENYDSFDIETIKKFFNYLMEETSPDLLSEINDLTLTRGNKSYNKLTRDFKTAEDIEKEKAPKHPEELRGLKPFDLFKAIW